MIAIDRLNCQVRLADAGGSLHGCGVICGPRHVLTCTHVVEDCLGSIGVGAAIDARFSGFADARATMTVSEYYPVEPTADGTAEARLRRDICVLELAPGSTFPVGFVIASAYRGDLAEDLDFSGLGLGAFEEEAGAFVVRNVDLKGRTGNYSEPNRMFVSGREDDQLIRPGCSGTAAFAGSQGLIGLIVEEQGAKSGFIIPIEILRRVWNFDDGAIAADPAKAAPAAIAPIAEPLNQRMLAEFDFFDREQQVVQFSRYFDVNWKQARRGFVCAIAGLDDDLPPQCRDRIRNHLKPFFEKQGFKAAKIFAYEIGWPTEERFDVAQRFDEMIGRLQLHVGADEADDDALRTGLNERLAPAVFYSTVDQRYWGKRHVLLLQQWSDMLARISAAALEKPLIHFLIIRLDKTQLQAGTAEPDARLERFYRDLDAEVNRKAAIRRIERTDRLRDFERDFVENWVEQVGAKLGLEEAAVAAVQRNASGYLPEQESFRLEKVEKWIRQLA
ncbi:hypothetical protein M0208_11585 [Sphingomonas sp. SUN019]|uniref:hypothetical protein n=1 Tax=Sphingomonas sp. SUN019 TaxID=2937788 RepID=UPI0021646D45|nr:hypothetical protein [Sphingomonas sp. SUN019]UVO51131.1 hypothetical protein M0208_11585 [Sphingomonas sp. SUN019]